MRILRKTIHWLTVSAFLLGLNVLQAQPNFWRNYTFSQADSLRGALRPERTCYDVTYYELDIRVDIDRRRLDGYVDIHYRTQQDFTRLQIDLFANMTIERIVFEGEELSYERRFNAVFVDFPRQTAGSRGVFRVYYGGRPKEAINPPWNGGLIWKKDQRESPWVAVACQGIGASLWWPNKDHLSDEPDSMTIRITAPEGLPAISNGHLRSISRRGEERCYEWFVSYPINNYNVSFNIGRYVHLADRYDSAGGQTLPLDYYVLEGKEEIARDHFAQVKDVLACLEAYLGPYPFPADGFALIETPYNGMEHQSGIAYGNRFMKGYLGTQKVTGVDFDYVIMHEAAHEYFGNSLSCTDMAEIWLHESFTTYMESVFVECRYGYEEALQYLQMQRLDIGNRQPLIGPRDINWDDWDNSDNYNKGAWVLHTLRGVLQNDEQWFDLLRGFYERHRYGHATTEDWIAFVNDFTGRDFRPFFQQYLYHARIPRLQYRLRSGENGPSIRCRWRADVQDFAMPVQVRGGRKSAMINVTTDWTETPLPGFTMEDFQINEERYLIETRQLLNDY